MPSNNAIDSGQQLAKKRARVSLSAEYIYFSAFLNKMPGEKISGQMTVIFIGNSHKETRRSLTPARVLVDRCLCLCWTFQFKHTNAHCRVCVFARTVCSTSQKFPVEFPFISWPKRLLFSFHGTANDTESYILSGDIGRSYIYKYIYV